MNTQKNRTWWSNIIARISKKKQETGKILTKTQRSNIIARETKTTKREQTINSKNIKQKNDKNLN